MGEFVGFAAQVLVFFIFTPFCLIARHGGHALDVRHARAECRAVMRECGIDHVEWQEAGEVLVEDGALKMPDLPDAPGVRRLEFVGPYPGLRSVTITGAQSLHRLTADPRPGRQFADDDMVAHVTVGGVIHVSYIDEVAAVAGVYDLADRTNRVRVVDLMRQQAELEVA
jgi:hypothetical protein